MKIKKEYSILILIIAVISVFLIARKKDRTHYELPGITPPASGEISKFVFSSAEDTVVLERNDDKWRILPEGYIADRSLVDRMIEAASGFSITTLVAESGNYATYDLEDDQKISLEVYSGEEKRLSVEVGKKASTNRHTFVRLEGRSEIYQAKGNIRNVFDQDREKLRDKTVFTVNKDEVVSLKVLKGSEPFDIIRNPGYIPPGTGDSGEEAPGSAGKWQGGDGSVIDEATVSRIISSIASIRCDSYINDIKKDDFSVPVFSVTVNTGIAQTLSLYEGDEERYPAVSTQSEYPFFLSKWKAEQIIKGAEKLFSPEEDDPVK
ncbi:MAG: DUF4340 domain-containing protein [Candidatus Krumholzibacteriota bacterium]|nr:DUF4340 domain-containing protein [Candidatus Krumholzibacteriota bacterium]